ncbi:MAG: thiamine pyrophosphate-dependent dehydrogenase E1 component subunit alpha [Pseudomonadota bacterium]
MTPVSTEVKKALLASMILVRRFEEKIIEVYGRQDMKTPVHLCIGQEAVAAGVCAHLSPGDVQFSTHRNHGHCLARGAEPRLMYAEFYGREAGCCRGRGGSMHPAFPELGIPGTTAIVGGTIPLATGAALAFSMRDEPLVAVAFFGDGASDQGVLAESLSFAALHRLPVIFACENNGWATASPLSARQPSPEIFRRAEPFGLPSQRLDGNDVFAIYQAMGEAVDRARKGGGPTLLEFLTYRWKGHVGPECDWEQGCRPREELEAWMERCPIKLGTEKWLAEGAVDRAWLTELYEKTDARLDAALAWAREQPFPEPTAVADGVFGKAGA